MQSQHPSLDTFVEVAYEPLNKGKSWLITFSHAIFQDDVDSFVIFPPSLGEFIPPSCVTDFQTASGVTQKTVSSVTKNSVAGSMPAGTTVFVRLIPINHAGIGPHNLAVVSADGTSQGSIKPRSPPGLPINVHVYQVPASVGDYLKVTWKRGE